MMPCPNCQAKVATRCTKLKDGVKNRIYVCKCGWSFDTREVMYRTRSPEQRERYRLGDPAVRSLAAKAKSLQWLERNGRKA